LQTSAALGESSDLSTQPKTFSPADVSSGFNVVSSILLLLFVTKKIYYKTLKKVLQCIKKYSIV
jgi:hypothetical protein